MGTPGVHPQGRLSRRGLLRRGTGLVGAGGVATGVFAAGAQSASGATPPDDVGTAPTSVFDVTAFGAVGDGEADDYAAIQAAIDAASEHASGLPRGGGAVVYVPSGLYNVSDTLRITTSNVGVAGVGTGSMLQATFADGDIVYAGRPSEDQTPVRNVFFEHLAITASVQKTSGAAIMCEYAERFRIHDVKATPHEVEQEWGGVGESPLWDAFFIRYFDTVVLSEVMAIAQQTGVKLHGRPDQGFGAQLWLLGGSRVLTNRVGVHIAGSSGGIVVEDTDIIVNEINVLIDDSGSGSTNREIFLNQCFVDGAGNHGIDVAPNGVAVLHLNNTWVSASGRGAGGIFETTKGFPDGNNINYRGNASSVPGTELLNTVIVDGCRIFNAFGSGIAAYAGRWVITGCNVLFNGLGENGGHGIALLSDDDNAVDEAVINGNTLHNTGLPAEGGERPLGEGIHIANGVNNYIITSNRIRDNATGHLVDKGRGAHKIVKDNLIGHRGQG